MTKLRLFKTTLRDTAILVVACTAGWLLFGPFYTAIIAAFFGGYHFGYLVCVRDFRKARRLEFERQVGENIEAIHAHEREHGARRRAALWN